MSILEDFKNLKTLKQIARDRNTTVYKIKKVIMSLISDDEYNLVMKKRSEYRKYKAKIDYLDAYYNKDKIKRRNKASLKRYYKNK